MLSRRGTVNAHLVYILQSTFYVCLPIISWGVCGGGAGGGAGGRERVYV